MDLWELDPAEVAAAMVEIASRHAVTIEISRLRYWRCTSCEFIHAVYAVDDDNRVWFALTLSTEARPRTIAVINDYADIDLMLTTYPCEKDRQILASWYGLGLRKSLEDCFAN